MTGAEIICLIDGSPFTKELDLCSWDFNHSIRVLQPCGIGFTVVAKCIYCGGAESSQPRRQPAITTQVFIPSKISNQANGTAIEFPNSMRWYAFQFRATEVLEHVLS